MIPTATITIIQEVSEDLMWILQYLALKLPLPKNPLLSTLPMPLKDTARQKAGCTRLQMLPSLYREIVPLISVIPEKQHAP